ncbi:hypothetical protein REPUB_Repub16aG0092900 [Reevesia pubescens]
MRNSGAQSSPTMLCIPIIGTTVDQMLIEMQKAREIRADVVEILLDCLMNFNLQPDLEILIKQSPLPTIVTYRPIREGGQYEGDETKRQDTLRLAMELGANYVDVELEVAYDFINSIKENIPDNFKIIVSSHSFHNTPSAEALCNLVARTQATGADIVKIATTALNITDCIRIFQITQHSEVPIIGVAMGERGLISCLLSPKFGGYLTYGALEAREVLVPGQPTAEDLLQLYNFRLIRADTKSYGIIGNPVDHCKSPLLYNAAFKAVGLNAVFVHFLVDDVKFFNTYWTPDFAGFISTMPRKEVALKWMDEIDPIAKKFGATNNILRRPDGRLIAFNTDYIGAISAIEDGLRAGVAGRALAYGAAAARARVVIANRTIGNNLPSYSPG